MKNKTFETLEILKIASECGFIFSDGETFVSAKRDAIKFLQGEGIELFEHWESLPVGINGILAKYAEIDGGTYHDCRALELELEPYGLTFDWGLDGEPFNLRFA
jgi:hypothetical protein